MDYEDPTATRTVELDVTHLLAFVKLYSYSFTGVIGFILARAVNHVTEFRHRLENGIAVEYERVIPSFVVLRADKQIGFAKGIYTDNFITDYTANLDIITRVRRGECQDVGPGNHGLFWFTNNPWNRFTSLQFPFSSKTADIPIFGVGKICRENGQSIAPLAFRIHHSFIDGYHVAHLLHVIQAHLEDPALIELPYASQFSP